MINKDLSKEEVIRKIIEVNKEIEEEIEENIKRNTGSYYTGMELSLYMMEELFKSFSKEYINELEKKTFLEPCLGAGSFVFAYLIQIDKYNFAKEKIKNILNNIYVCEINDNAIDAYKKLLVQFVYTFFIL